MTLIKELADNDGGPLLQEPGSYDAFLDADDWYMRDIIKSRKRGQL